MNISEPLPEMIELEYEGKVWLQLLDYEYIPFRCRRCHEYGHLYKSCPLNEVQQQPHQASGKEEQNRQTEDGFITVNSRRRTPRTKNNGPGLATKQTLQKTATGNRYEALQKEGEVSAAQEEEESAMLENDEDGKLAGNVVENQNPQSSKRKARQEIENQEEKEMPEQTPMEVE